MSECMACEAEAACHFSCYEIREPGKVVDLMLCEQCFCKLVNQRELLNVAGRCAVKAIGEALG